LCPRTKRLKAQQQFEWHCQDHPATNKQDMELREQGPRPTLAQKLGDVTHVSPLLRRVRELSGCTEDQLGEWLLKCAVQRGATHYRRDFPPELPPDSPALTNEELGVALCLAHLPFDPMLIRAAAQLLSARGTNVRALAHLAVMERCEPILLHIAGAAAQVAPAQEPWASLRAQVVSRRRVRTDALPHWSRFVLQTGYTPNGRGNHIEWLTRNE
jgi:hypothetical protein